MAEVKDCEPVKRAKKLLKLTLDDGSGTPRTVASGIAQWYKPEDLIGHKVVLVANLKLRCSAAWRAGHDPCRGLRKG